MYVRGKPPDTRGNREAIHRARGFCTQCDYNIRQDSHGKPDLRPGLSTKRFVMIPLTTHHVANTTGMQRIQGANAEPFSRPRSPQAFMQEGPEFTHNRLFG